MARRRKPLPEEPQNHERWLVSYADFITLLFAFFVVMYSISSVNSKKYESLSEALDEAFRHEEKALKATQPINVGNPPTVMQPIELDNPTAEEELKRQRLSEEILQERRQLLRVSNDLEAVLEPYIEEDLVEVKRHDFWVELEMNSELLFASGEAALSPKAVPVIHKVADVIRRLPNVVNVEGHTDNVPIDTVEFPSNWDLSAARATSVVRELVNSRVPATRLSAVGYGEFHPIADNNTVSGRFKNRRVVLVLMSQAFARYGMDDDERAKVLNFERASEDNGATVSEP
ncbi:flagellar motor protein MotD [Methylomarinum vadi]|uniref:flagellar motor protein MotD n=1 Tax=Methylomarinum vadi TaxID=438855 RepID=UPI00055D01F4|nr:flagellar motor protein MotD [Methylomarinum vadi]